ncbi:MAG: SMI1/KNR4 family protein [Bacilli bacterium]
MTYFYKREFVFEDDEETPFNQNLITELERKYAIQLPESLKKQLDKGERLSFSYNAYPVEFYIDGEIEAPFVMVYEVRFLYNHTLNDFFFEEDNGTVIPGIVKLDMNIGLDYRQCKENPPVLYYDTIWEIEMVIADSYEEFLQNLIRVTITEDVDPNYELTLEDYDSLYPEGVLHSAMEQNNVEEILDCLFASSLRFLHNPSDNEGYLDQLVTLSKHGDEKVRELIARELVHLVAQKLIDDARKTRMIEQLNALSTDEIQNQLARIPVLTEHFATKYEQAPRERKKVRKKKKSLADFWEVDDAYESVTEEDIRKVEQQLNVQFPARFVELYLKQNGGTPAYHIIEVKELELDPIEFIPIGGEEGIGSEHQRYLAEEWDYPEGKRIPFATCNFSGASEVLLFDYAKSEEPKIIHYDAEMEEVTVIAKTFDVFLKKLK